MRHRSIRLIVLTVLCGLWAGCKMIDETLEKRAVEKRLTIIFEGIRRGENDPRYEPQKSVCRFYKNVDMVAGGLDELGVANDNFNHFLRQKGLYPLIDSYEIKEIELKDLGAIATVVINGKELKINVPPRAQLSWVEEPKGRRKRR